MSRIAAALRPAVLIAALGGCAGGAGPEPAAPPGDRGVAPAPLAGTYWRLTELPGDEPFAVDPDLRAHLMLDAETGRVGGSTGCNRIAGGYTVDGDALTFTPLAGTRMACPPPAMQLEVRLQEALARVTAYRIDGETLTLGGPEGPVARFERYLE